VREEEWLTCALLLRRRPPHLAMPRHDTRALEFVELCLGAELTYLLLFRKIIARLISLSVIFGFPDRGLLLTRTWAALHVLPDRCYITRLILGVNPNHTATHPSLCLQSLAPLLHLLHPLFRHASDDGIVGLRNPASREPVRVRGDTYKIYLLFRTLLLLFSLLFVCFEYN
jgi:hypothetical protein